jgi:hypothetical protein
MKVKKENIHETVENFLKSLKIRYTINENLYELFLGTISGFIQLELSNTDDSITIQFFSPVDLDGNSLYSSVWDNENCVIDFDFDEWVDRKYVQKEDGVEQVEGEIEELITSVNKINIAVNKIEKKIEQIKEICEEYQLDVETFIDVVYDFDNE